MYLKLLKTNFILRVLFLMILILTTKLSAKTYPIIEYETLIISSDLDYLKTYKGKYPDEVKLLGNNPLTKRLKLMLKDRYTFLGKTSDVETPIEIKDNIFKAWGCRRHYCNNASFTIIVDFKRNVIYVGIEDNELVKLYSEDGSTNIELKKWAEMNG